MSRMIDRVSADLLEMPQHPALFDSLRKNTRQAEVFEVTPTARYFYEIQTKDDWRLTEFPNLRPPFDTVWMEFKAPTVISYPDKVVPATHHKRNKAYGCLMLTTDNTSKAIWPDSRWVSTWHYYFETKSPRMLGYWGFTEFGITEKGGIGEYMGEPDNEDAIYTFGVPVEFEPVEGSGYAVEAISAPFMFATSLLHCKNAAIEVRSQPEAVAKKWEKRHNKSPVRWYELEIGPIRHLLENKGRIREVGIEKALHVCRGHFKTYTEDAPLFGEHTGTYWWDPHVRGNKKLGIIQKDYKVVRP